MATFLISLLGAFGVVIIIILLGLVLAQIFINRANKIQAHTNIIFDQPQSLIIDIDELPEAQQEPGITVISNDVIEGISYRHHHLTKKTLSVIDQDVQINHKNDKKTTIEQIYAEKDLTIPTRTDSGAISSDISIINPLTNKITLEY
ncbi:unnamed protein product [Rotaria sp. Silwood2]|nr:unnamed protein product [Rotaria sp. Silwood2]CAF2828755.1 unnamed protein product [Rotaria sp. Silwood2]CAF3947749.1 unnamed protein product [Rotaria sp. Silwood2]CAF4212221.1 unnamed protein product [Rotaria sp. Silwood2]